MSLLGNWSNHTLLMTRVNWYSHLGKQLGNAFQEHEIIQTFW